MSSSKRGLGFVAAIALSSLLIGACGDSEGDSDGSGGTGNASNNGGGSQVDLCANVDLDTCQQRCDELDSECAAPALQKECREKCTTSDKTACQSFGACGVNADCDGVLNCWEAFNGTNAGGGGGANTCATACANVVEKCDGQIDLATCNTQCENYSQTAIDCAAAAATCPAVEACVGAT